LTRWNLDSLKRFINNFSFEIILTKKEIPIGWFNAKLRMLMESVFKGKNERVSIGPVERIRSDIGLKPYKQIKSFIKFITYPLASFLFYGLKFEGGELYLLTKKK
jgi:hypothetical protein